MVATHPGAVPSAMNATISRARLGMIARSAAARALLRRTNLLARRSASGGPIIKAD
jgi:hypothetical protein